MASLISLQKQQNALKQLIDRQEAQAAELRSQIARKQTELKTLESKLAAILGGVSAPVVQSASAPAQPGRGGRLGGNPNSMGQKQLLIDILRKAGKPLSITEILAAMAARGYKWESASPRKALGVALYPDRTNFKKVKRGYFTVAGKK